MRKIPDVVSDRKPGGTRYGIAWITSSPILVLKILGGLGADSPQS